MPLNMVISWDFIYFRHKKFTLEKTDRAENVKYNSGEVLNQSLRRSERLKLAVLSRYIVIRGIFTQFSMV